ncbi:cell division protein ZapA [Neorhizobium sp. JUb45]|uniref:cell division protein ZapA n=1 Tax=unclassified Neorhizobium TaxID=2629175 RepID=UPI0010450E88|nr:cell division protein ZapA [Neorhizobium sp. JUb45]TCR06493.1 cell division protein ZapA [Neorhizobium sp. JUb45]
MAQVTVTIDGKAYRMACEEGQEQHLEMLAGRFDQYVGHLKSQFGEIGDLRITVMAGIMIMDELNELNRKIDSLQGEITTLRSSGEGAAEDKARNEALMVSAVEELTARLQAISAKLLSRQPEPAEG